ncbi:hypothetical protein C0992_002268, partial [Termitomyces sp. T32_za158]
MANAQAGSSQRVLVSLAAAPSTESSAKWKQVQSALRAQLPLRNIHWKSASHTSIRTIQELEVELVPLDAPREEHTQIPVTLLEKPLLNIYIVVCQNTDLEGYKNTVKKQIKDWHSSVTTRKNQEWLIVHVVRPDTRTQTANFFQLKGSVLEKIRSDFNADKKERCVQVAWSPETDAPAVWAELVNKIKDGVLTAFDLAVAQREEEVRRSESQRQMPGWNFCTFFILKESLAYSYEGVNLPEDAYAQYEELEMSFYHVLKEENLSWFGTLITPASGDDSASLLSFQRKAYRDLILANTISIFDFRIYLLSRQCELLAQRGRLNEVCRKVAAFLVGFGRRLRDVELDTIGFTVGHLPQKPPFSSSCTSPGQQAKTDLTLNISNGDLLEAIGDDEAFYQLYTDATNRAIELYIKAGRRKFALRLHGSLAALDLHRGEYKNALSIYTSLPAHYAPHMWTSLEAYMLSKALDAHADYQQEKDTEWIHILLSFLKSYVDSSGADLLTHEDDQVEYISKLVDSLHQAACKLSSGLPPGKTTLTLFYPAVAAGTYLLESSELRVAKLYLQWQHRKSSSKTSLTRKENKFLVHVPKDQLALDVNISQPDRIELGEPPTILVAISTGRNHVVKAFVKLTSSGVTFWPKDAYYDGEKRSERLQVVDNSIILEDIPEYTTVSLMIPHSDTSAFQAMKITAEVEYMTVPEPSLSRTIRVTQVVLTTLPISVNVEDFFRGSRHQHVRICTVQLVTQESGLEGVKISTTATKSRGVVVEAVVDKTVAKVVVDSHLPRQHRTALITQLVEALERDAGWVDLYGITGELRVPETPKDKANEETAELLTKAKE